MDRNRGARTYNNGGALPWAPADFNNDGRNCVSGAAIGFLSRHNAAWLNHCTRNAVTNCTPLASLTRKILNAPIWTVPTSALALPWASVVILARLMHAAAIDRLHTALLKVWFGKAPVNVTWAVEPVTVALPVPGELPVVWPMPPVMVAAGNNAKLDWIPLLKPMPVTWTGNPVVSMI